MGTEQFYSRLLARAAVYGVPIVIRRGLSVVMLPFYTRYMSPEQYGVMDLLDLILFMVTLLFGLKLGDGLFYFYHRATTEEDRARVVSTSLLTAYSLSSIVILIGVIAAPHLSRAAFGRGGFEWQVTLCMVNAALLFPLEVGMSHLRARDEVRRYATLSTLRILLQAGTVMGLMLATSMRVDAFLWSNLVTSLVITAYTNVRALRGAALVYDRKLLAEQVHYTIPLALHGLGMMVIHFGDRFFMTRFHVPLSDIGLYGVAYKLGMTVSYFQAAFDGHWRAHVFGLLKTEQGERLYTRTFTYYLLVLGSASIMLIIWVPVVFPIVVGPRFASGVWLVPIIVIAYLCRAVTDFLRGAFWTTGRTRFDAQVTLSSAVVTVVLYVVLIPWLGMAGAALASLGGFAFMLGLAAVLAQRVRPFAFEYRRIAVIALAGAISGSAAWLLPGGARPTWVGAGIAAVATLAYMAMLGLFGFATQPERNRILALLGWADPVPSGS